MRPNHYHLFDVDTKCNGLIAICDGINGYSLNLHGTSEDNGSSKDTDENKC